MFMLKGDQSSCSWEPRETIKKIIMERNKIIT